MWRRRRPGTRRLRGRLEWPDAARHLGGRVVVAVDAGPGVRGGHGHSGLDPRRPDAVSVRVRHERADARLDVETSSEPDWFDDADTWRLVGDWAQLVTQPDRVVFPLRLQADRWVQAVPVDGEPAAFTFVGDPTTWSAHGRTADRQVSVTGDGWPCAGLALVTVDAGAVAAS